MARLLLILLFFTCAGSSPYERALRTPHLDAVAIYQAPFDLDADGTNDVYVIGYDLNEDKVVDLVFFYRVMVQSLDTKPKTDMTISNYPYRYVWFQGDYVYASQYDMDMDGKVESVNGDIVKLNKSLDKL